MKYDDAEFYFIDFSTDLPQEHGGRHISAFLEWAIRRGLASEALMAYRPALLAGETDGVAVLFDECDGKLLDSDLGDEGNAFAREAYAPWCLADFAKVMEQRHDASPDALFGADYTPVRHARLLRRWDVRYADWLRATGAPDATAMMERLLPAVQPVLEKAGFACVSNADNGWSGGRMVQRLALFERTLAGGMLRVQLTTMDTPGEFRGVGIHAYAHDTRLHDAICAEKRQDMGTTSEAMDYAVIPFARIVEDRNDPLRGVVSLDRNVWVFRDAELDALAAWLASRLRGFVLPALRDLDGVDGLALAYCTQPGRPSLIGDPRDPYPTLLAAEQARHPRLQAILTDTEAAIHAIPAGRQSWTEEAALKLIARIRQRTHPR